MIKEIDKHISRAIARIRQAFRGVLGRVSTNGPVSIVQGVGLAGEILSDLEMFQHYGLTSSPPPGSMAVIVPVGGKTSHGIVIATEHGRYRLKELKSGEVALYTQEGDSIVMENGRVINIQTKTLNIKADTEVNIDTPKVNVKHQLDVADQISGRGGMSMTGGDGAQIDDLRVKNDAVIGGISFDRHKHPYPDGTTDTPVD